MAQGPVSLLHVLAEQLENLDDNGLTELMDHLFAAEAAVVGMKSADAIICSDTNITDGGQDGRTGAHAGTTDYFPAVPTCWQFKAGDEGAPSKLEGEVTKEYPAETLGAGGAYIVVTSKAKGPSLRKRRLKKLVDEAKKANLPTDKIDVYESEVLARWCSERLGVALYVQKLSAFCMTPSVWRSGSRLLSGTYVEDDKLRKALDDVRAVLNPGGGSIAHVHVEGLPGVGKTRLALEAIEGAPWKDLAICFDGSDNAKAIDLLQTVALDARRRGVVVVDEVQAEEAGKLNAAVQRCGGRVRMLTIGTQALPLSREECLPIKMPTLNDVDLGKLIAERHPRLLREQAEFCASQAHGYVKFADVLADLIEQNPGVNLNEIFEDARVADSLTRLLVGTDATERRALSLVALFTNIGWHGELESELKLVAKHFGLKIADFRRAAENAHRRFGICPMGGRRRYISPDPLANYLASEAWRSEEEAVHALPEVLKGTPRLLDAFQERLKRLVGFQPATVFAQRELDRFFDLTTLNDERAARVWSIVSAADPARAVANLLKMFEVAGVELARFGGRARREIVWALERLTWPRSSFGDAMRCLAMLALAENESYANNATGVFLQRFQPQFGGTEVPFIERLTILDELLQMPHLLTHRLVLQALDTALSISGHRMGVGDVEGHARAAEWEPSFDELTECRRVTISRIEGLIDVLDEALRPELLRVFRENVWPMSSAGLLDAMAELARKVIRRYPEDREEIRRSIASTMQLLERTGREGTLRERLATLETEFSDTTFSGRLKKFVGDPAYTARDPSDEIRSLAKESLADPRLLDANREWLRSSDARGGWLFGVALGEVDRREELLPQLVSIAGRGEGGPMFSAYLRRRTRDHDGEWLEDELDKLAAGSAEEQELALDVTQRQPGSHRSAARLQRLLAGGSVPPARFAGLAFGPWAQEVPAEDLRDLVMALPRSEIFSEAGAAMLGSRVSKDKNVVPVLEALLVEYATRPEVIRGRRHADYHWKEMAIALLPRHAEEVAKAIFACQLPHENWFIEHSYAADVLGQCVQANPGGVWRALAPHLQRRDASLFVIGFPDFIVPRMPAADVLKWVEEAPERRGVTIARLLPGVGDDASVAAQLVDKFGHIRSVSDALFTSLFAGSFWGPMSARLSEEAAAMDKVSAATKLPRVRRWTRDAAASLRRMADRERQREAEEELHR